MVPARRVFFPVLLMLCFATMTSVPSTASDLSDALKLRDVAKVRSLLAAGADVKEKVLGDYPLNIAARFGPAEVVTVLLDSGADIKRPGRDGLHPLHNAVLLGHTEIVALLIQRGAAVDAKDRRGRTPLYSFAATGGSDIEIAKMLLAAGANPRIEDENHDTALPYVAETGRIELGELLIAAGADVNHVEGSGWNALHLAVHHQRQEFVKLLIAAGADVNQKQGPLGKTPISYVGNDTAMKQLLVAAGAK